MKNLLFVCAAGVCAAVSAGAAGEQYAKPRIPDSAPTFSRDVAPILYKHCTSCHRPGEIAPMSLLTYKDARPWARAMREEVSQGTMPPWHADPAHGEFLNDRRLNDADKDTIVRWVTAGAPEGRPEDLPQQPSYVEGWQIGQPDVILSMNEDYPIPADGTVDYKYFYVPTNFTEDKYVQAIEARPGNRAIVHHIIVFMQTPKPAKPAPKRPAAFKFAEGMDRSKEVEDAEDARDAKNDRPAPKELNGYVGGFAPGQSVRIYQPGTAIKVPAGATLVFQMHYTASGTATTDRTRVGLKFAKEPVTQEVRVSALLNQNFTIPPNTADYRVDAEMTIMQDLTLWSLLPHTHLRGKRWEIQATYPDGRTETILSVPKYDFNWQTDYVFKTPLKLPKGTKVHTAAWYDNSTANQFNPDAAAEVKWGDQTWDEMQFTAFAYTVDKPAPAPTAQR